MTNPPANSDDPADADASAAEDGTATSPYDEDCLLCASAPHPNCERYTTLVVGDPATVPIGEGIADHVFEIPVCLAHYEAIKAYQGGTPVADVDV